MLKESNIKRLSEENIEDGDSNNAKKGLSKWWVMVIPVVLLIYFFWWAPRQKCVDAVVFHPKGERGRVLWDEVNGSEYYSYSVPIESHTLTLDDGTKFETPDFSQKDFKTKGEAVAYCMRSN